MMEEIRFKAPQRGWYPDWPHAFLIYSAMTPAVEDHMTFLRAVDWCTERFGLWDRYIPSLLFNITHRIGRPIPRWAFDQRQQVIGFRDDNDALEFKLRWV